MKVLPQALFVQQYSYLMPHEYWPRVLTPLAVMYSVYVCITLQSLVHRYRGRPQVLCATNPYRCTLPLYSRSSSSRRARLLLPARMHLASRKQHLDTSGVAPGGRRVCSLFACFLLLASGVEHLKLYDWYYSSCCRGFGIQKQILRRVWPTLKCPCCV